MHKLSWYSALILMGVCIGFATGCKKNTGPESAAVDASKLPGAGEVMAAIDKKDYDGAMAALMKVREGATNEEQNLQFIVLARQARNKLGEAAATDPKAAEAVSALRAMTAGR